MTFFYSFIFGHVKLHLMSCKRDISYTCDKVILFFIGARFPCLALVLRQATWQNSHGFRYTEFITITVLVKKVNKIWWSHIQKETLMKLKLLLDRKIFILIRERSVSHCYWCKILLIRHYHVTLCDVIIKRQSYVVIPMRNPTSSCWKMTVKLLKFWNFQSFVNFFF